MGSCADTVVAHTITAPASQVAVTRVMVCTRTQTGRRTGHGVTGVYSAYASRRSELATTTIVLPSWSSTAVPMPAQPSKGRHH